MKNKKFFTAVNEYCASSTATKEQIYMSLENAIVKAYAKSGGVPNSKVVFNEEKEEITIYEYYTAVKEEELDEKDPSKVLLSVAKDKKRGAKLHETFEIKVNVKPEDFNRVAAYGIKNMLYQDIKKIERDKSYEIFKQLEGEMVVGTVVDVKKTEKDEKVIFDLGNDVTTVVSANELAKEERRPGVKVKLYISSVTEGNKGPKVIASRSDKNLIKRLFEDYISEIKDGVVEIVGIARDNGDRTKVCVKSTDPNVDALGSCLGPKGKRIKDIIDALNGEKIDVYEWSDDPKTLVANALKPAEIIHVQFDQSTKQATAICPDDHFSLAIGKKGQNVRLAVQSSGWKIDIKSVSNALEDGIDF